MRYFLRHIIAWRVPARSGLRTLLLRRHAKCDQTLGLAKSGEQNQSAADISVTTYSTVASGLPGTVVTLDDVNARLLSVLRTIPDIVWLKNTDGVYLACNHAFEQFTGLPESELIGKTDYELFSAALATSFREKDMVAIKAGQFCSNEEWVTYAKTGKRALFETRKTPVLNNSQEIIGVLGVARDITEHRLRDEALTIREREFRTLVENSPDSIVRFCNDLRLRYVNPAFAALVGIDAAYLIGKGLDAFMSKRQMARHAKRLEEVFRSGEEIEFELEFRDRHGKKRCSLVKLTPELVAEDWAASVLAIGRDITELCLSRHKIHQMAYYDALTLLPNAALFNEQLRQAITDSARCSDMAGVMIIDIDRFKEVNETMGHPIGNELLQAAAARLRACVRRNDTVARLGGDSFAILLPSIQGSENLSEAAGIVLDELKHGFILSGLEIFVSCSIGIAIYPDDSQEADDLTKFAHSAMHFARRSGGRQFRFYSKDLAESATKRLMLESELRRAIERQEFELHYQPKVALENHEVVGSEALIRWNRSGVGLIPPKQFIPVAEETGLIADLGIWVLREACRTAAAWNTAGSVIHKIAVNISVRQFQLQLRDLPSMLSTILEEAACSPEWLELEITESLLLDENDVTLRTLSELRSMGVSIAIDDFGTGYSALSYLARFPIDTLKIDQSFVQKLTTDRRHAELVKAILSIARCLGQQVVAEGVETVDQAAFLEANGCKIVQGYLYSKPLPKLEMESLPKYLPGTV